MRDICVKGCPILPDRQGGQTVNAARNLLFCPILAGFWCQRVTSYGAQEKTPESCANNLLRRKCVKKARMGAKNAKKSRRPSGRRVVDRKGQRRTLGLARASFLFNAADPRRRDCLIFRRHGRLRLRVDQRLAIGRQHQPHSRAILIRRAAGAGHLFRHLARPREAVKARRLIAFPHH